MPRRSRHPRLPTLAVSANVPLSRTPTLLLPLLLRLAALPLPCWRPRYHVHEKAALMVVVPLALAAAQGADPAAASDFLFLNTGE